ncbi:Ribokinase-like protein [Pyronema omphalodes]|nr:Ribokinase-like protein [Pyronema omphalodes]
MTSPYHGEIHFTTLGMFIIDEIHYGPDSARKVAVDIIGGGGTYGVLGARIFSPSRPSALSKTVGWIVDAGSDFPAPVLSLLESLNTHLVLRHDPTRLTTRGWNSYGENENRAFKYLTPKKRLDVKDLVESGLEGAKCVHLICSPVRAMDLVGELAQARARATTGSQKIVWEPVPDLCTPENKLDMFKAAKMVDVLSPNHDELSAFWSPSEIPSDVENEVEYLVQLLLDNGVGENGEGSVVVRLGKNGCLVANRKLGMVRLPAYYESTADGENNLKVVDPTGGGNTFIGGMSVGLVRTGDILKAAATGSVAAGFAIEQIGMPEMKETDGVETWNGERVVERLEKYVKRVQEAGVKLEVSPEELGL